MNVLLTGATGFIGRALTNKLISEGVQVYGVVRSDSPHAQGLNPKLHIVNAEISEPEKLLSMQLPQMQACIHLAWKGAAGASRMNSELQNENVKDSLRWIQIAHELGCERFIFPGSQAEYGITLEKIKSGQCKDKIVDEKCEPHPVSEYGKAKLRVLKEGRKFADNLQMTYVHARIFSVYGKGDQQNSLISVCAQAFKNNEHISLTSCEQKWNFVNVNDCAKALADLTSCVITLPEESSDEDYVINIAGSDTRVLKDFVKEIHEVIGRGSYDHDRVATPTEGTPFLNPDISKLVKLTGFKEQFDFREGIKSL